MLIMPLLFTESLTFLVAPSPPPPPAAAQVQEGGATDPNASTIPQRVQMICEQDAPPPCPLVAASSVESREACAVKKEQ